MKRRDYHIGPGAASLMLVVVVVSMSVLGLLALMSARGDARLAERSAQFTASEYAASAKAEAQLAALDGVLAACRRSAGGDDGAYLSAVAEALPQGMTMNGRLVSWTVETEAGRSLLCGVELTQVDAPERYLWRSHKFAATGEEEFFE